MGRKTLYSILAGIALAVCVLTGFCEKGNSRGEHFESRVQNCIGASLSDDSHPQKQEGDVSDGISLPQQVYNTDHRTRTLTSFPHGGLDKQAKHHFRHSWKFLTIYKQSARRESAPFTASAPRFYYVIALRRIVI
ncbi:MAG: hypothetical protein J5875_01520 [Paludibacteraceae bacterium]|nr:hypothetical protein [Paludibacteraceae bacterium]